MTELRYLAPDTLDEAIGAFAKAGSAARILAGGTDLLVQMRSGMLKPGVIVDIKKIPEMMAIEQTADGGLRVGAAVSGMALSEHKSFGKVWPGVLEAVNLIGSKQVQGRASAGGNLCNGSPAGDSVPAMVAAGAIVTVQGPDGRRELKVEDVPAGPGRTNLKPGEILVSFTLPPRPPGSSDAYLRMIPRTEMDIAVVGVGVSLTIKDGTVTSARVGLGAVAPTVLLVEDAAKALIGSKLDDAALAKAAAACSAACRPIDDKRGTIVYRTKVAGVLLKRTAAIAAKRAQGNKLHGQSSRHHVHQRRADGISVRTLRHHARRAARAAGAHRLQGRLRLRRLRRLLDHARRSPDLFLPDARRRGAGPRDQDHRGHGAGRETASAAAKIPRSGGTAVWHLYLGHAGRLRRAAEEEPGAERGGSPLLARRQPVQMHRL
jgi:aerobic carbon-monoxide dehydrogenase medium subunit